MIESPGSHNNYDVAIAGGGLAGLSLSILLAKKNYSVILFEKEQYPFHKVCGEYVSNEVLPFLQSLGFHPHQHGATSITKLRISDPAGNQIYSELDLGGFGISRFTMDKSLSEIAVSSGVTILEKTGKLLSKVKVSGGGRCNVTHSCFSIADMVRNYPRGANFLKKTFHQFFTTDTIQWYADRGVTLKKEDDGRMFPITNSSQTIIDCLMKEANLPLN